MPRVYVADKLESQGLDVMRQSGLELDVRHDLKGEAQLEAMRESEGMVVRSSTKVTAAMLENPGKLRVIVRAGVGVDTIDVGAATRKGILVMNTPSGNTVSTAEQSIALLLAVARHTPQADASMRGGKWEKSKFLGTQLAGKTIGVVGLGRIGREVAKRCLGLDMKVVGFDPFLPPGTASQIGVEVLGSLDALLPRCDFLTVHTPLTDETRDLIGEKQIALMPKGARIINCARGGIINEDALLAALKSQHLAGAALDVFVTEPTPPGHPLVGLPNVVVTPHLGAATVEAQASVALEAAQLLVDYLNKGIIGFAVNLAAVDRSELEDLRLAVDLARRLGLLQAQMATSPIQKAVVSYRGDLAGKSTRLITAAFTAGLLEGTLDVPVNIVNAGVLAKERGLVIVEESSSQKGDFATLLRTEVVTAQGNFVASGTLFGNQYLRLVHLGQNHLDSYLDGVMLLFTHRDVPGLIGFIGTIFGKHQVNIAQMTVGRQQPGGEAIAVLNLDSLPPEAALDEVRKHPQIQSMHLVKLPPAGQLPPWFG